MSKNKTDENDVTGSTEDDLIGTNAEISDDELDEVAGGLSLAESGGIRTFDSIYAGVGAGGFVGDTVIDASKFNTVFGGLTDKLKR